MKKQIQVLSFLLVLALSTSCKRPQTHDTPVSTLKIPGIKSLDSDPYFKASTKTISTKAPSSITRNILQDKNGIIWLATWEGIISYDGTAFTNHTNKEGLSRFHVFDIIEDRKGILWFATIGAGVYRYDGTTFTHLTTNDGLVHDSVTNFYEDTEGYLWIGTLEGASRYDGSYFKNYTTGMPNYDINSIIQDEAGHFWFGTRGELCRYDGEKFESILNKEKETFTNVRKIIVDKKGTIWFGGNDGLWQYDSKLKGAKFKQLTTDFTGYIFEDSKGNIWTCSSKNGNSNQWTLTRRTADRVEKIIDTEMIFGITEDKDGNIWFGSVSGVCRYDGSSFEYFKNE